MSAAITSSPPPRASLVRRLLHRSTRPPTPGFAQTEEAAPEWSEDEQIAHVLRRLTMTAHPEALRQHLGTTPAEAIETLLANPAPNMLTAFEIESQNLENEQDLIAWWVDRLTDADAGLHERMTWFWHTHLTSSLDSAPLQAMWKQHHLLREHALGSFRDLMQAMAIDAAMLYFLDGANSYGEAPNENFSRECMELFCLGVGNYTEDDIRVAARGFSGWRVDYETGNVTFDRDAHYDRPLRFFGERKVWTAKSLIDKICDQPACAEHVARSVYRHLVGSDPSVEVLDSLAATFRDADLEIAPLVAAIARHPDFLGSVRSRPRSGLEWYVAMETVLGAGDFETQNWWLWNLEQMPFYPPNVAGWPDDERWVSASQALSRTGILLDIETPEPLIRRLEATVDIVTAHCGVFDLSEQTRAALDTAARNQPEYENGLELLLILVMTSPEFALA